MAETDTSSTYKNNRPRYKTHAGSLDIAGDTIPSRAAEAAAVAWQKGVRPVEFVFIGSNSGGQAIKAVHLACRQIRLYTETPVAVLPLWFSFADRKHPKVIKDGMVLRLVETIEDTLPPLCGKTPEDMGLPTT